ncbi:Dynein heavy chain, partial [Aduncisulcus paluster]
LVKRGGEVQDELTKLAPVFEKELVKNVKEFVVDVADFKEAYDTRGPNVSGIKPKEAVQRLREFQSGFSDRERKWVGYEIGEELFGLPITKYPALDTMKKELKFLNALYSLYTDVLTTVNGYADELWSDLDFMQIQQNISDYESRMRRLPKDMRDWEAYLELKKTVDDFNESLPLFQALSQEAIRPRHWQQVSELCGVELTPDIEGFTLQHLLSAPLLEHKEDIEDITNAAGREEDIEAKLADVITNWQDKEFQFEEFKTRGPVTLAPAHTSELITVMEDTQMALGSLVSNRYNKPFKEEIVDWVKKLSTASEIIDQWLNVQQNWIYLEAVFSGGDIARQLPQEAKRFANIDRNWGKIMNVANSMPNVIQLTSGDETLKSMLPHLTEHLELCQKSLSGYLESKKNLFPRFYFVSDPVLLEMLGQQSDPHAIQPHFQ